MARTSRKPSHGGKAAKAYDHKEQLAVLRPDISLQAHFKKKKEPATYRYDRSLDPQLSWDINLDREHAEALIEKNPHRQVPRGGAAGGRGTQARVPALPQLGRQGRAPPIQRAHPAAVRT